MLSVSPLEEFCKAPSPLRLMIIEDVDADAELITLALEATELEFVYDRAETVADCDRLLVSNRYDVVLSDYRLNGWNAYRALEVLRHSGQSIPFILVTGSLGEEAAVECIRSGMTDYVLKDRLFRLPHVIERACQEFETQRQRQLAIAQLERQAHREAIINRIVQAMRGTLILSELLQSTADHLHDALAVDRCLIFQPNEQQEMVVQYISQKSSSREFIAGKTCAFVEYYHDAIKNGKTLVLQDLQAHPVQPIWRLARTLEIETLLVVPLIYQASYLGGIILQQQYPIRQWTEHETMIVEAIAAQCAIAIHQVNLYEQVQLELTERKRIEARLRHDAFHDALTGLPNRSLLMDRLEQSLCLVKSRHQRQTLPDYQFAVLFLDLDHFKVVNDSLGHLVGDMLLNQVAQRLRSSLRIGDTVARLGGDEFVFLLEDIAHIQEAIEVANRVQMLLQEPFQLNGHEVFIGVSIGIAMSSLHYQDPSQILRDADTAMYSAKAQGRSCYTLFNASMHDQAMRRLNIENDLRRAIENNELRVYYQPIFDLNQHQIYGAEALVRWQHPKEGLLAPGQFIHMAEEIGLITDLDWWVCREACRQLSIWQTTFPHRSDLKISLNFSGRHFTSPHFFETFTATIKPLNIQHQSLKLEITESTLMSNANLSRSLLERLQASGVSICLDDFGTGYSSLSYLHQFPIHTLKIDRSFISNMETSSGNQEIIKAIINLGLNLNLAWIIHECVMQAYPHVA
ncbi:MAG: EAL domain-containing protein [Cyanothece sp. SIO2G6]|nr:EAL domain-containing protein [Cyanothece sp. SIO2G6]